MITVWGISCHVTLGRRFGGSTGWLGAAPKTCSAKTLSTAFYCFLPGLVNVHKKRWNITIYSGFLWKITIYSGFSHETWWFSHEFWCKTLTRPGTNCDWTSDCTSGGKDLEWRPNRPGREWTWHGRELRIRHFAKELHGTSWNYFITSSLIAFLQQVSNRSNSCPFREVMSMLGTLKMESARCAVVLSLEHCLGAFHLSVAHKRCSWDAVVLSELPMLPMWKVPAMSSTDWDKWRGKIVLVIHWFLKWEMKIDEDWWRLMKIADIAGCRRKGRKKTKEEKEDTKIHWEDFRRLFAHKNDRKQLQPRPGLFLTFSSCSWLLREGHKKDTATQHSSCGFSWCYMLLQWHSCCTVLWRCIEVFWIRANKHSVSLAPFSGCIHGGTTGVTGQVVLGVATGSWSSWSSWKWTVFWDGLMDLMLQSLREVLLLPLPSPSGKCWKSCICGSISSTLESAQLHIQNTKCGNDLTYIECLFGAFKDIQNIKFCHAFHDFPTWLLPSSFRRPLFGPGPFLGRCNGIRVLFRPRVGIVTSARARWGTQGTPTHGGRGLPQKSQSPAVDLKKIRVEICSEIDVYSMWHS